MASTAGPAVWIPAYKDFRGQGNVSNSDWTFNANSSSFSKYYAGVFVVEESITCTRVLFRQVSMAGSATKVLRIGLMAISTTTGAPDGTWLGYYDYTASTGNNGTTFSVTLDTSVSLTQGNIIAVVVEPRSGFSGTETVVIRGENSAGYLGVNDRLPHRTVDGTHYSGPMAICYGSSTKWYGYPPIASQTTIAVTTNEVGCRVKFTCSGIAAVRLYGLRMIGWANNGIDTQINVYSTDSGTTAVTNGTISIDGSWMRPESGSNVVRTVLFPGAVELATGTYYYIGLKRNQASDTHNASYIEFGSGNDAVMSDMTRNWEAAYIARSTAGSGSFTVTSDRRMEWDYLIDGYESNAGGGGGGLIIHPGMTGGMRG